MQFVRVPAALERIRKSTAGLGFQMASEPLVGALLRSLAASKPAGRFLELGTGTGIATAWLLDGMDRDSTLTSVDSDDAVQQVARETMGRDSRLNLVMGDALKYLLVQPAESFDLLFADALPGKYEGLEWALAAVRVGGFYVIDDMLPQENWPEGHAAKVPLLLERLACKEDFTFVPMQWASGVVVAVRTRSATTLPIEIE